jgi:hypothetical protein
MLFNLFINDLVVDLEANAFEILAFADDLAVICRSRAELLKVMAIIESWSLENEIKVNKKKSGILFIQNRKCQETEIEGYPIRNNYKYLGIRINDKLSPRSHLISVNVKLTNYLKKNEYLIKQFFTPKSLILIAQYYQMSRLSYGISAWLDQGDIMEIAERMRTKYLKSIVGLKENVSNDRMRLVLHKHKLEVDLYMRLHETLRKYEKQFKERASMYDHIMRVYENWLGFKYSRKLKECVQRKSVFEIGKREGIDIGSRFYSSFQKNMYKFPDKRDALMIRYFVKFGFFDSRLFPICQLCKGPNSRTHVTDECSYFDELRKGTLAKIGRLTGDTNLTGLEAWLMTIYFAPHSKWKENTLRKLLEVAKAFSTSLYIDRPKRTRKEMELKQEDEDECHGGL